jgi:serine phosphatase RsbU (regulator of sigma subunit)
MADEILSRIPDDIKKFCGNAPQFDDSTQMVIRVL